MAQFMIAYNPHIDITGEKAGGWILVEAEDKSDALNKALDIPVPGFPQKTILDESDFIYIIEVRPDDKIEMRQTHE